MKKTSLFLLIAAALIVVLAFAAGAPRSSSVHPVLALQATATDSASELPPDMKPLSLDKPLIEDLNAKTPIRFYSFAGKAGTNYQVSIEPKSGDYYTTLTVMTPDLATIIAGTIGETVISGSVIFRTPTDAAYVITVEYAGIQGGTPASGSYQIVISEYKAR